MPTQIYDIKEPDYDEGWFRYRSGQALAHFEADRVVKRKRKEAFMNVLAGLYRHAYNKGRHDEKRDQAKRGLSGQA